MADARRDIRTRFIGTNQMGAASRGARRDVASITGEFANLQRRVLITNQLISGITLGIAGSSASRELSLLQQSYSRLSNLSQNYAKDQAFLSRTSRALSIDIRGAANALSKLRVLEESGAINQGASEQLLIGLGEAFSRFGATAGQQENVIYGLAQALGQGTLQAAELNQVVEPLPGLLNDIAAQAGLTAGEYRALVKEGNYLSETFLRDVLGALKTYDGTAASLSGNIQQTLTRLSNAYKETLLELSAPITVGVSQIAGALEAGLRGIANNSDTLVGTLKLVGTALAVSYGARATRAVSDFTSNFIAGSGRRVKASQDELRAYSQKAAQDKLIVARQLRQQRQIELSSASEAKLSAVEARRAQELAVAKKAELVAQSKLTRDKALSIKQARDALAIEKELAAQAAISAAARSRDAELAARAAAQNAPFTNRSQIKSVEALAAATAAADRAAIKAAKEAAVARDRLVVADARYAKQQAKVVGALKAQRGEMQGLASLQRAQAASISAVSVAGSRYSRSVVAVRSALAAAVTSTGALTVRMRAQAIAARALTLSMAGLRSAYAFIGGGFGAALIAAAGIFAVYKRVTEQSDALRDGKRLLEEMADGYTSAGDASEKYVRGLSEIAALQKEVTENAALQTADLLPDFDGDALFRAPTGRFFGNPLLNIFEKIKASRRDEAQQTIDQIRLDERRAIQQLQFNGLTKLSLQQRRAANRAQKQTIASGIEAASKFKSQATETQVVLDRINAINAALEKLPDGREKQREILQQGLAAAKVELAKVTGVTKAREDQVKLVEDLRKRQRDVVQSFDSEIEAINRKFDQNDLTIRLNLETLDVSGQPLIDKETASALLVKNEQKRQDEITKIQKEAEEKRAREAKRIADQRATDAKKALDKEIAQRREYAQAIQVTNPRVAANELFQLAEERLRREYGTGVTYTKLLEAEKLKSIRFVADEEERIQQEKYQQALKNIKAAEVDKASSIFGNFAQAGIKDIESYIEITDDMTASEKARAEEQNRINRKQFEKNKKFRIASALVDTFAGANRALAQGGIWGIAEAAGIVAVGLRNVANIRRQSFSGGSAGSSSGGSSSLGAGQSTANQLAQNQQIQGGNVFMIMADGLSQGEAISRTNEVWPEIVRAADSQNIRIREGSIRGSDLMLLRA